MARPGLRDRADRSPADVFLPRDVFGGLRCFPPTALLHLVVNVRFACPPGLSAQPRVLSCGLHAPAVSTRLAGARRGSILYNGPLRGQPATVRRHADVLPGPGSRESSGPGSHDGFSARASQAYFPCASRRRCCVGHVPVVVSENDLPWPAIGRLCSGRAGLGGGGSGWRCPSDPGSWEKEGRGAGGGPCDPCFIDRSCAVRAGRDGMKWLSVCWWASRAAPAYLARYLPPHLARVCGSGTSQLQTPYLDASQARPRLGPISRISLRLFQLSNPSIRLQTRPHLHCSPAVIESPASQLFHRPRCPVLEPFLRVDAPRSKAKVIGPTAPGHGQPRPSHTLQAILESRQGKQVQSLSACAYP